MTRVCHPTRLAVVLKLKVGMVHRLEHETAVVHCHMEKVSRNSLTVEIACSSIKLYLGSPCSI